MKLLTSFLIVCVLALAGCSKDNPSDPGTNPTTNNSMKATINGTAWSSSSVVAIRQTGMLQIGGSTNDQTSGSQITVGLLNPAVGTYDMSTASNGLINVIRYNNGSAQSEFASSGTVTVTTSSDTEIAGTFSCTAGQFTVTNGEFKVKF